MKRKVGYLQLLVREAESNIPLKDLLVFLPNATRKLYDLGRTNPRFEPTQEQIEAATAKIRSTWSPDVERSRRSGVKREYDFAHRWEVPVIEHKTY